MDDVLKELSTAKAELADMTDEVFELQTLLEATKRNALDADQNRQLQGYTTPGDKAKTKTDSGQSLSQKQREDMILARVRQSPAYKGD